MLVIFEVLGEQLTEKSLLISKLRGEITALECASLEDSKSGEIEEHHILRKEIESLDEYVKELHADKEQLYSETDVLRDKVGHKFPTFLYYLGADVSSQVQFIRNLNGIWLFLSCDQL